MSTRTLLAVILFGGLVAAVGAVEFIELNDKNQNILNLELSKGVGRFQDALRTNFQFEKLADVRGFIDYCEYVKAVMAQSDDSAFEGMAKTIKALLGEKPIDKACRVTKEQLDTFEPFDVDVSKEDVIHLSEKRLNKMREAKELLESDENVKVLLGTWSARRLSEASEKLLDSAPEDFVVLNGERWKSSGLFDFDLKYKERCSMSGVKDICKFARRTKFDDVEAVGDDFLDFVESGFPAEKIAEHERKSLVPYSKVKEHCAALKPVTFTPMKMIESYLKSGFLAADRLNERMHDDSRLDFYYNLYRFCSAAISEL